MPPRGPALAQEEPAQADPGGSDVGRGEAPRPVEVELVAVGGTPRPVEERPVVAREDEHRHRPAGGESQGQGPPPALTAGMPEQVGAGGHDQGEVGVLDDRAPAECRAAGNQEGEGAPPARAFRREEERQRAGDAGRRADVRVEQRGVLQQGRRQRAPSRRDRGRPSRRTEAARQPVEGQRRQRAEQGRQHRHKAQREIDIRAPRDRVGEESDPVERHREEGGPRRAVGVEVPVVEADVAVVGRRRRPAARLDRGQVDVGVDARGPVHRQRLDEGVVAAVVGADDPVAPPEREEERRQDRQRAGDRQPARGFTHGSTPRGCNIGCSGRGHGRDIHTRVIVAQRWWHAPRRAIVRPIQH